MKHGLWGSGMILLLLLNAGLPFFAALWAAQAPAAASPTPVSGGGISAQTAGSVQLLFERQISPLGPISGLAWSPDGRVLAVTSLGGVFLLDGETLEMLRELKSERVFTMLSFSADGSRLAASGVDMLAQVWDVASGTVLQTFRQAGDQAYLSPDGKTLAAVTEDQEVYDVLHPLRTTIRLLDVASGQQNALLSGLFAFSAWNEDFPRTIGVFFSVDGKKLQTVSQLGDVRIWDIPARRLLNTSFNGNTRARLSLGTCTADGAAGAGSFALGCSIVYLDPPCVEETPGCMPTTRQRYELGLWDANQIRRLANVVVRDPPGVYFNLIYAPDGGKLGLLYPGELQIWDLKKASAPEQVLANAQIAAWTQKTTGCPSCAAALLAFRPGSGGSVLAAAYAGTVELWDVRAGQKLGGFTNDVRLVTSAALGVREGQPVLAAGLSDGTLSLTRLADGQVWSEKQAHSGPVGHLAFVSSAQILVSAGTEQVMKHWSASGEKLVEYPFDPPFGAHQTIYAFASSPAANLMAVSRKDAGGRRFLSVLEAGSGVERQRAVDDPGYAVLSLDGRWLAEGKTALSLWNMQTGKQAQYFSLPSTEMLTGIALSPDDSLLAAGQEKAVLVWDVLSGALLRREAADAAVGSSLAFSPDGCLLAVGEKTGRLTLLDLKTRQVVWQQLAQRGRVKHLEFSLDGRVLLSVGADGTARVWGLTGALQQPAGDRPLNLCRVIIPLATATPLVPTGTPTAAPTQVTYQRELSLQDPPMTGNDVLQLQQRLSALGYALGAPDGSFGPKTDQAVRLFQQRNHLKVDGVVGPITWRALFSAAALRQE